MRLGSMTANMELFQKNPVFGLGLAGANIEYTNQLLRLGVHGQTSTSLYYMAAFGVGGIVYTLVYVLSITGLVKRKKLTTASAWILIISILYVINKEPHTLFVFTYCFWFYLIDTKKNLRLI